jgi:hypothetical protein
MKTNKWILKFTALIVLLSISAGCKSYMSLKYGITQPKEETPARLTAFLEKNHFPAENLYMFSDSASYCQEMRDPEFSKYLIGHMIFTRDGTLLKRDTAQCQWAGYDLVKSLHPDSVYEKSSDVQLSRVLPKIIPFGMKSTAAESIMEPDFTLIVTWAKFIGKYNYRLFVLDEAVRLNTTARIRLIWLNVDMQESWKLTPEQRVAIR